MTASPFVFLLFSLGREMRWDKREGGKGERRRGESRERRKGSERRSRELERR